MRHVTGLAWSQTLGRARTVRSRTRSRVTPWTRRRRLDLMVASGDETRQAPTSVARQPTSSPKIGGTRRVARSLRARLRPPGARGGVDDVVAALGFIDDLVDEVVDDRRAGLDRQLVTLVDGDDHILPS